MATNLKVYALSTCGWCRKTVSWLNENDVPCDIIYVDQLTGSDREQILSEMSEFNPKRSFPTLVIDEGRDIIIGYQPEEMERKLL